MKNRNIFNVGSFSNFFFFFKGSFFNSHLLSCSSTSQGALLYLFQLFHDLNPERILQAKEPWTTPLACCRAPHVWCAPVANLQAASCLCCCPCVRQACALSSVTTYLWMQAIRCLTWCRAKVLWRLRLRLKNRKKGQADDGCYIIPIPQCGPAALQS